MMKSSQTIIFHSLWNALSKTSKRKPDAKAVGKQNWHRFDTLFSIKAGVTQHPQTQHPSFPLLRPPSWINPNAHFYNPQQWGWLAGEQEPNEKKCHVVCHPSMVMPLWVLVHSGCT
jgi:hypothetical protein